MRLTFDLQRQRSRDEPAPAAKLRLDRLDRLRAMTADNADRIVAAISSDFGVRSPDETRLLEIMPVMTAVRHTRHNLKRWMRDQPRDVAITFWPGRAWLRFEPLGVIGVISPWNYPLLLALGPMIDAVAAGNRVMLKPSELTPNFSALLAEMIGKTFDASEAAVVQGGVETAQAFSALPFDHLVFTGSTAVGRKVAEAAAANLTPVTLELGGKSPAIVAPDYDVTTAARSIGFGKFLNAGQTCIAPDYVLAPAASVDRMADAVLARARQSYPAITGNDDYSSLVSDRHHTRLIDAIEAARQSGAKVLQLDGAGASNQRKIPPTVVINPPGDSLLMREEIFGPVLPIVGYQTLDDALARVRAGERPLALYAFTKKDRTRRQILNGATSGGVTLNGTLLHIAQDELPFGGVGASGQGAYHGVWGFRRFSHIRAVYDPGPISAFEHLGPPWGKAARMVGKALTHRR
jgi:coniferyl-aldehyde dehydrogenase